MGISESLGIPSPDECIGIFGLTAALIGITIGITAILLFGLEFAAWVVVVASLLVGWVSFLYCVVWGESSSSEDV